MTPAGPQLRLISLMVGLSMLVAGRTLGSSPEPLQTSGQSKQVARVRLPLQFEENRGQTDAVVKFLARGRRSSLFLAPDEVALDLSTRGARTQLDPISLSKPCILGYPAANPP